MRLDKKNQIILDLLQKDCRMSLTDISRVVGLSVDSTKKRIKKMFDHDIFYPKIQLRPRNFGFNNIVDVKIRINNYTEKELKEFIGFLEKHERVVEIFSVSGDYDYSIVIIAKNAIDQGDLTHEIRSKFNRIITAWSENLTTHVYKFEDYDMEKVMKDVQE